MSGGARWHIAGISGEVQALARAAAQRRGVGVGDWLDAVIRARAGLDEGSVAILDDVLPANLLDTLDDIESRIAAQADDVESLVAPLAQSVDRLDARVRSVAAYEEAAAALRDDAAAEPFFAGDSASAAQDRDIADTTVAGDLGHLFDDGDHAGAADSDGSKLRAAAPMPLRPRENPRRGMLVAAAIVVVLLAVAATLFEWAHTSTVPQQAAPARPPESSARPTQTAETAATARLATNLSVAPAGPATVATKPLMASTEVVELTKPPDPPQQPPAPASTAATDGTDDRPDPSFARPVPPKLAEGSPIAALYHAAENGDRRAQYDLAIDYLQGKSLPRDFPAAAYWLREAATDGLAPAQYNLGVMYDLGLAGRKDPVEAMLWFKSAAEQNHARSFYAIGLAYAEAKGVPRDAELARHWFTRGAEAGITDSQLALGVMSERGLGGPQDIEQAYYWYRLAELGGNRNAGERIAGLGDRLTTAERAALNDKVTRALTPGLTHPATAESRTASTPASTTASVTAKDTVRAIQSLLAELGFDPGPADGDAGPKTRAAVEAYQKALGLPVDGRPDAALLANLRAVTGRTSGN